MAFVALKRKLVPQGTWGSGNPGKKAKGDQIAKKNCTYQMQMTRVACR